MTLKKVWLVTVESRCFGALIVEKALEQGDSVVAIARKPEAVSERFGENPNLIAFALDVTDEAQAHAAAKEAVAKFDRIDVLVNNAGHGFLDAVEEASAEEVEGQFRTNVFGLLGVTRAVLPHMRKQSSGQVLNFSSIGGYQSALGFGVYCTTKFAVEALTEALHGELAPLGIHVTAVEPGYFWTDFLDSSSLAVSPVIIDDYAETSGAVRKLARELSHNQPGNPAKLADAITISPRPGFFPSWNKGIRTITGFPER
jgi:NAD(P)-dependent dehydrogenase (short-subunit alcohol dehydrogenase family)